MKIARFQSSPYPSSVLRTRISGFLPTSLSSWIFALSLIFAPMSDLSLVKHVSFGDAFVMIAIFLAFIERVVNREPLPILPRLFFGLCLLTVTYLSNDAFADNNEIDSYLTIILMMTLFPQAFLFLRMKDYRQIEFMVYAWTLGCLLGAMYTIAYCNGYFSGHIDPYWHYNGRARGLTPHPNRQGLVCFLGLPGMCLFLSRARSLKGRVAALIGIGVLLRALDYSATRSSVVASLIVLTVWAILSLRQTVFAGNRNNKIFSKAALTSVLTVSVLTIYSTLSDKGIPFIQRTIDRLIAGDDFGDAQRSGLNQRALEQFLDNPLFGDGFHWFGVFDKHVAHNMYLSYLSAAGFFGLLVLLLVVAHPMLYPVMHQLRRSNEDFKKLNIALLSSGCGLLVWLWPQSGFTAYEGLVFVCFTLYVGVWRIYENAPSPALVNEPASLSNNIGPKLMRVPENLRAKRLRQIQQ